ncbi:DUF5719 family protein [Ruania alba]|uniref:Secreted protein n=1 Tax=Ruania alba TaxID=648782 RepID=A0A1H5NAA0_9MICO|nr:DUF5719 family protein [Ruania alba]SEE98424.1 hypothetical protein SAMN04488554_4114 [Ruania alba]
MSTDRPWHRRVLSGVGRAVSGVVVLALAAAATTAATVLERADTDPVAPVQVDVGAAPLTLVCPPAPVLPTGDGGDLDYDDEFDSTAETDLLTSVVVPGRDGAEPDPATAAPVGGDATEIATTGAIRLLEVTEPQPTVVEAQPSQERTALAAGASVARTDAGDLRGLTAAPCQQPTSSAWLVGGQTELGASARLTLTNPGSTPVTATVQLWGATGPVEGEAVVAIPPGETRTALLESVTLEPRVAVQVQADGGRVTASLQETVLAGLVPQGSDVITAASDPSTDLLVGPIPISADPGTAALRLVNAGQDPAQVSVEVLGAEGPEDLPGAQELVVEPGTVADIALDGIDGTAASLRVTSDQPVTGAALVTRGGESTDLDPDQPVAERAWMPATGAVEHGLVSLAGLGTLVDRASVSVTSAAGSDQTVSVRAIRADGTSAEAVDVPVPTGATVRIGDDLDLTDAVAVEIVGDDVLASAILVSTSDSGALVGLLPMTPDAHSDQSIEVRVGTS